MTRSIFLRREKNRVERIVKGFRGRVHTVEEGCADWLTDWRRTEREREKRRDADVEWV